MTQFKQNNTSERVTYKPVSENGFAINLTGATAQFVMIQKEQTYINAPAAVDEANSQLVYEFTAQDTLYSGVYTGEFRVTFADGTIKHYPEKSYLRVQIDKVLDPTESTVSEDNIAYRVSQFEDFKTQSATDASGKVWGSLQERLNNTDAQLAEKATKTEINDIGIVQINKNKGLFDETYFSDSVKQQWTGSTPVNATPPDGGVTTPKLAEKAVTIDKIDGYKLGRNLFDVRKTTNDMLIDTTNGNLFSSAGYSVSDYIKIDSTKTYFVKPYHRVVFYDVNKVFVSGISNPNINGGLIQPPVNAVYVRVSTNPNYGDKRKVILNEGNASLPFEPFRITVTGLEEERLISTSPANVSLTYDSNGRVQRMTETKSGKEVITDYAFDSSGKLTSVTKQSEGFKTITNLSYSNNQYTGSSTTVEAI